MKKFLEILERKNVRYKKIKKDMIEIPVKRIYVDENNAESDDKFKVIWYGKKRNALNDYCEFSLENEENQELEYCEDLNNLCYVLFGQYELEENKIEVYEW